MRRAAAALSARPPAGFRARKPLGRLLMGSRVRLFMADGGRAVVPPDPAPLRRPARRHGRGRGLRLPRTGGGSLASSLEPSSLSEPSQVVYCFPDLLATAGRDASYGLYPTTAPVVRGAGSVLRRLSGPSADRSDYWEEGVRPFATGASAALQRKVYAVACANLCAAVVLGGLLGPLQLYLRRGAGGAAALTVVNFVYGGILANGLAWLLLPAARRVRLFRDNWAARGRNRRRRRLAEQVLAAEAPLPFVPPHGERIARGMRAARRLRARGREHEAARDDVVYTTAKDVLEQAEAHDPSREAWDAELERRTGRLGAA